MGGSSNPTPSCTLSIMFALQPKPTFTYFCRSVPPPWHVSSRGDIVPCSRSRVIELNLESEPSGATFIGVRSGTTPQTCNHEASPYQDGPIVMHRMSDTQIVMDDDSPRTGGPIWYAPGVELDGQQYWDDPKIYNPPDD